MQGLMQKAKQIAGNDALFANANQKHIAQKQLFANLVATQTNVTMIDTLNQFTINALNNTIGNAYAIDTLIATNTNFSLNKAQQLNNAMAITNLVDGAQQQVNNTYIPYNKNRNQSHRFNYKLNVTEVAELEAIANLCPNNYGQAVYQARTILFNTTGKQYINNCEKPDTATTINSGARLTKKTNNITQINEIKVYPNPAQNKVFVDKGNYTNITFKLYNLIGELVLVQELVNDNAINTENIINGIYMYSLTFGANEVNKGKLIIAK